jgi:hypothetical protein
VHSHSSKPQLLATKRVINHQQTDNTIIYPVHAIINRLSNISTSPHYMPNTTTGNYLGLPRPVGFTIKAAKSLPHSNTPPVTSTYKHKGSPQNLPPVTLSIQAGPNPCMPMAAM